ncbi:MAG: hypothetical protein M0021_16395 [Clostridia bacterium]|nr:hypothetical protein [Clostridia bacterium]
MKKYYFVGGPKKGHEKEFFQRLAKLGGSPAGWTIFPHAGKDGKALHIVETSEMADILNHLGHFTDIYERSEIVEVVEKPV